MVDPKPETRNPSLFIGVDLGTTAVKAALVDGRGRVLAAAAREMALDTPRPGFVEFDADRYIDLAFDAMREVLDMASATSSDTRHSTLDIRHSVRAIGLSSQAQTFVLLDENDRVIRPAVGWLDVRGEQEAKDLSHTSIALGLGPTNAIDSGPKVLWLKRHEPESIARTRRFLVINDYLILRLTGRAATEPGTAQATAVYDRRAGRWVRELMDLCGLRPEMMPEVLRPGQSAGPLTPGAARRLGLSENCLVAVGANDQTVGAVGAGNVTPGCASVTLGTALALIVTSARDDGLPAGLEAAAHAVPGLFVLLAYAKTAGIVLRWFRDQFAPLLTYEQLFEEIARVPIGCGGLSCLPHFSGSATPTFNPAARGAFSGLTLAHGRAHLARAVVEALTFTIRENLDLLGQAVGGIQVLRAIGGGAKSDIWLQMIADATGVVVERPATSEAACLGAAELAMVAAGRFASIAEASLALYRPERRFEPNRETWAAYDEAYTRYRSLYDCLYGAKEASRS